MGFLHLLHYEQGHILTLFCENWTCRRFLTLFNHTNNNTTNNYLHPICAGDVLTLFTWLQSKLPKGFGAPPSTGKTDAEDEKSPENAGTKEESASEKKKSSKTATDSTGGSGGGSNKDDKDGKDNNNKDDKKDKKEKDKQQQDMTNILMSSVAASAFAVALWTLLEGAKPPGEELSWQEFRNVYLATGMVDRLEVINKEIVRVYLRNTPNRAFLDEGASGLLDSLGGGGGDHANGNHTANGSTNGGASSSSSSSSSGASSSWDNSTGDREAELRRALEDARSHKALFFRVGSVEGFERQLEDAQLDLHVRPRDFILVRYANESDTMSRIGGLLPYVLMFAVYAALFRMMGGGGGAGFGGFGGGGAGGGGPGGINRVFSIGKAKPTVVTKDTKVKVTFKDVAGCDEAKAEIMEFVSFLKDPSRFTALGAKIPKGALLVGPPGTGKTLLAKATAGEAGTPFFSMSGSDFIEMFVGVGPSRVRDLFAQARQAAPCIIFIDEIDAVARARNKGGFSGGNDERENTLNQLLVEMDGFSTTEGVVVLAGTNRADILDKAILRPGRFDRQILVDKPDIAGRREIFRVHMKAIKLAGDPDLYAQRLAALTPGFVGADIANICNEAAIHAARGAKSKVDLKDFEAAIDRIIGGLERRNSLMTPEERRTVAFHEAGHAIAGWFLEHADPLLKVTIIPRGGGALGFAQYLPKEVTLFSKEALLDRMCMALGGRVSEEIHFGGRITTGASDDLDKVTQMAYAMTTVYGMNTRLGTLSFPKREETQFDKPYSDATAQMIDEEVRLVVEQCYARTKELLTKHTAKVTSVAELLLAKETINQNDLAAVAGERPFPINPKLKDYVSAMFDEVGDGGASVAAAAAEEKKKQEEKKTDDGDEGTEGGEGKKKKKQESESEAGGPIPATADLSSATSSSTSATPKEK